MKVSLRFKFLAVLMVLALSGLVVAQDADAPDAQDTQGQQSDPPTRVARLQYVQGQVSLQPGGVDDWVDASLNRPLTTADRIWTDRDSRAELTLASMAMRMGDETSVTITNLDDNTAQIELDQGSLNLSVRYLNAGEIVEVDTPNFAYTVSQPGNYRFDVIPDEDQSWISVRHGDGEATGEGNAVRVRAGQRFRFFEGQSLTYSNSRLLAPDGFDDWCEVREQRETSSPSARYVAAGTVGYEDLDDNGYWEPSPIYGTVWYPRVHPGWAPYREGHWAWVEPWGWTWVDDAPWGFAPFHYGRWVNVGDRWGWVPGPVGVRPVYAPALVAWVGGPSFGVSVGIGEGIAWVPLGWHDPFIPAYRVSPVYARAINVSNSRVVNVTVINNYYSTTNITVRNTTINNIRYENVRVNGAVTGVPQNAFASGRPIGRAAVVIPTNAVGHARVSFNAAVVPTREAVLGGHAPVRAPQRVVAVRPVASRMPPPPRPVSFEQQRPLLEKSNGVPLPPQVRNNLRRANPAPEVRGGQPAWNRQSGRPPVENQQRVPVTNQAGGSQTFGHPPTSNSPARSQSNAYGRSTSNVNQPPANGNQNSVPTHSVPRPPQTGATNEQVPGAGSNSNTRRIPTWTSEGARAPANDAPRTNPTGKPTPAPSSQRNQPAAAPAAPAAAPPAQPQQHTSPARTGQPTPQNHNAPPPAKEKVNESKDTRRN